MMNISKISICTVTVVCQTSCCLKYDFVCDNLELSNNIVGIEYQRNGEIITKGTIKNKKSKTSLFYNQITLNINLADSKYINSKVFTNGKIQMTGCRSLLDAIETSSIIVDIIDKLNGYDKKESIVVDQFKVKLINSIFNIGINIEINREHLYRIITNEYSYYVEYVPDEYPGVRIKYRHYIDNNKYNWTVNDVCQWLADLDCHVCVPIFHKLQIDGNKLLTLGVNDLNSMGIKNEEIIDKILNYIYSDKISRNITIIIFRTGNIMITGAKSFDQLIRPYNFINNLLQLKEKELITY